MLYQFGNIIESQSHVGWKRHVKSLSATVNQT